jgi:hypothetical protein
MGICPTQKALQSRLIFQAALKAQLLINNDDDGPEILLSIRELHGERNLDG